MVTQLFQKADTDGSGARDKVELQNLLGQHGVDPRDIDVIMTATDIDGDGLIQFDEFMKSYDLVTDCLSRHRLTTPATHDTGITSLMRKVSHQAVSVNL